MSSSLQASPARIARPQPRFRPDTLSLLAGTVDEDGAASLSPPIYQTTTFAQSGLGGRPRWCYARTGNPTRLALEEVLAAAEEADHAFAFASGLAAANAVLQALVSSGDRVVASQDLYGGCWRLFQRVYSRLGVEVELVDATSLPALRTALARPARLVWLETPSNPLLRITDLAAACAEARRAGALSLVDGTFATSVFQRPLDLGADLVLHSTTKYVGGHCDVLGGAVVCRDEALAAELRFIQNATGAVPSPQDCALLLRGARTLSLRVRRQAESAGEVARALASLPGVARVWYPGLREHPGHAIHRAQASGDGAIVSLELEGGRRAAAQVVESLRLFPLAESLGGVRSLVCHPATMTHAALTPEARAAAGIDEGLLRLSIGLEDPRDLVEDLVQAIASAGSETGSANDDSQGAGAREASR